jgi:azurin
MKFTRLPALILAFAAVLPPARSRAAEAEVSVTIVASDLLRFSVTRIEAHPGQRIHVELRNEGTMPKESMGHDWVLLKAGADPTAYAMSALAAKADGYQPKALAGQVLASIALLGPKEDGTVDFNAPEQPGRYIYICSSAGHALAGMRGELIVR